MRLGGWLRLWVVLAVLWAIPVALIGYNNRPTVEYIKYRWVNEAIDKLAAWTTEPAYQVREKLSKRFPTNDQTIAWLERIEANPRSGDEEITADLRVINTKFRKEVANHPSDVRQHAFSAFLWWFVPMLFLLGLGYGVAWIRRGFRQHRPA